MKYKILYLLTAFLSYGYLSAQPNKVVQDTPLVLNQNDNPIKVVAHRGDWRNAPENSIPAIEYAIAMGVDIVEIDISETKDGHLILMHDKTIDRTTKSKGLVKDYTLAELKELYLVDGINALTPYKIPTLQEVLVQFKDKVMFNLDKSYDILDKCVALGKKTNTLNQLVFKSSKTREEVKKDWGDYLNMIHFMPIVNLKKSNAQTIVLDYIENYTPFGFEIIVPQETNKALDIINLINKHNLPIWMNSLWDKQNAGHGDEKAMQNNEIYNWYINHKVSYIQTDRPEVLIKYLKSKNLHN
ncbi:glycerophosphodiester phosphodiesterase family protein [Myroides odoratimimus]|uniref:glycerophosphodiester phosphodiesterase family protein n=1 Tax=Myroides odoratimimus TaxID=76832 RepID=UPI001CE22266|nr:glycerophosphodiester phosphodiesterase family protein [Myroides odoratimimus]MCA4806963.1 glycerophosphodiester phosphodiesterase family protein [Myroides odoratimimus]